MAKTYVRPAASNKPNHFQTTIKNLIWRLRSIKEPGVLESIRQAISENEQFILDLVREDQLYDYGINGRNVSIDAYAPYTMNTVRIKTDKRQPTDRVTLCDTGDFYKSMNIVFTAKGFYIEAHTSYVPDLMEKYGTEVLRLTDENFTHVLVPFLRAYAFDYVYKMIYDEDPQRAAAFAKRLKPRMRKDYESLSRYA